MHLSPIPAGAVHSAAQSAAFPRPNLWARATGWFEVDRSLEGLSWLNLLIAQMQTAFGAFLAVYLTSHQWNHTDIGMALSIGTMTVMVAQVPAGALVDLMPSKRLAAGGAILAIAVCALMIGLWPGYWSVMFAEALHGGASCVLTPALAAITLALTRPSALGERFGRNVQFAAIGGGAAALVMGLIGYYFSHRIIFFLGAGCGLAAFVVLRMIRSDTLDSARRRTPHPGATPVRQREVPQPPKRGVLLNRSLLIFAGCMALFQLGNAAVLPIAAHTVALTYGRAADLVVAAAIFVPLVLAATLSPRMGRLAESWGRRPVLLLGLGALPIRAMLFAFGDHPALVVSYQILDGLSGTVLSLMIPLVIADLTRVSGRFNLAIGVVGLAIGIGATLSTLLGGAVADHFGNPAAFAFLALAGLAAVLVAWRMLPETAPAVVSRAMAAEALAAAGRG